MLTLYDIPSTHPGNAWSPNPWKARYCLNFKGIPYQTTWVEYPDIEGHCKRLGIAPTGKKFDGNPLYTLPAIYDPSTGVYVSDSLAIAEYLDKTYPDTPTLFPNDSVVLQRAFVDAFMASINPLLQFALPVACLKLNPRSQEYFRRTREQMFGKKLEEVLPTGENGVLEWAKFEAGLAAVDGWYGDRPFVFGESPSWADFVVAAFILSVRTVSGAGSQEWKDVSSWNDGRWGRLVKALDKYEAIL